MSGYQPGEQPQAGKFIKLNTNENPYPPSPAVGRAISAALAGGLSRYPDPVADAFRRRAAQVLGVEPDWILCGNGSDDILTIVTRAFVGEGQLLRMPYPSYVLYRTLAEIQGTRFDQVAFQDDWSVGENFTVATGDLRLAFLANPNSPSGTMVPPARVQQIAEQLPCPLLVDEAYVDFADDNCLSLVAENENILVSRSLSKSYALAGLRFGYVVAQPHVIEGLLKIKDSYNCDALSIAGATAAIDDQDWLKENRGRIIATRTRMTEALKNLGFDLAPSEANFVWATHANRDLKAIYEKLKAEHVLIRYMNFENWGDGIRVSVGTDEQIDAFLVLLKNLV